MLEHTKLQALFCHPNYSPIAANVSFVFENNGENAYSIGKKESENGDFVSLSAVNILPNEQVELLVQFSPSPVVNQYNTVVHLKVLDNDFDQLQCHLHGNCKRNRS